MALLASTKGMGALLGSEGGGEILGLVTHAEFFFFSLVFLVLFPLIQAPEVPAQCSECQGSQGRL